MYSAQQNQNVVASHTNLTAKDTSSQNNIHFASNNGYSANQNTNSSSQENKIKQMLQQPISITDTVANIYPGAGFVIADKNGTKMFVQWNQEMPSIGNRLKVEGKLANAKQNMSELQHLPGFTKQLQSFLQSQPIYLQATQVTPV